MTMRLREGSSHPFQPATGVQTSPGSHVYTFSNGFVDPDSSSEEEFDVMELRARGGQRPNATREKVGDVVLLERAITEDDTLNKLALQYACKVADIKRVNNLITEQDMYALKMIKIPVKANGLLMEQHDVLNQQQRVFLNSGGSELPGEICMDIPGSRDLSRYFQEIDKNIEAATQTQDMFSESLDLDSESYSTSQLLMQKGRGTGADWGIRWWNAVLIMLLIGIVLPVFYIIYKTKSTPEDSYSLGNGTDVSIPPRPNISTVKQVFT
ncbi:lysM and putative peptidoglycan-binding domain-containing protein 4 [Pelodytes ibericus]